MIKGAKTSELRRGVLGPCVLVYDDKTRTRRHYSITDRGRAYLVAFRAEWSAFIAAVDGVLGSTYSSRSRRRRPTAASEAT